MSERSFGPVVVRRRLGAELRRLREAAGMSLDQAARTLEISASKLSRVETGHSPPKLWDVRNLLTVYGVTDEAYRRRAERWVGEGRTQGWWAPYSDASPIDLDHYISLESEAVEIWSFSSPLLYGLLQTEDYARAVLQSVVPVDDLGALNALVSVRMRRQSILDRGNESVRLRVVLDEAVLHRRTGGADVMRAQIQHLMGLESVHLVVRSLHAPFHPATLTPFTVFTPRESDVDPTVVNVEAGRHDAYFEQSTEVESYRAAFNSLEQSSLNVEQSRGLMHRLVEGLAGAEG